MNRTTEDRWTPGITLAFFLLTASTAQAIPLTWGFVGASFDDQGMIAGSFDFDADTETVLGFSISVSGGNTATFPDFTYNPTNSTATLLGSGIFNITGPVFPAFPNPRQLRFTPVVPLTNAGGLVDLELGSFGTSGGEECYNCSPFRVITGGQLASPIPEPGTVLLFGLGLVGVARTVRRRRDS